MDIKEIRRQRLKEWFAGKSLPEREKSYLSQLMNGKSSFGEKAARRIEGDYGMPLSFLDTPYGNKDEAPVIELDEQEKTLIELFRRLPDAGKKEMLQSADERVQEYDALFDELMRLRQNPLK
ncbi:hypothetical protein ABU178_08360 [Pantoea osteomyelitidis]|uniref:Transcriptional regulator n=1 Tax=Pantoea osteomyelitidis TaxID=3230026 RepID=A0ABW7PWE6_9GAMM